MSTAERSPRLSRYDHASLDRWRDQTGLPPPDHTQLPDRNDDFVQNFQEHPQSVLLTVSIAPVLDRLHPDGHYAIGQDCGIYWRLAEPPEPLHRGAVCPDWFYIPDVPPTLQGTLRRSYVLWKEPRPPLIVLEFVSGDGSEERDRTPKKGKFWVYEQMVKPRYYGIFEINPGRIEMHRHLGDRFAPLAPNERGRFPIEGLDVELGLWEGRYQAMDLPWMRWWDAEGRLLPTGEERADREAERADREADRARREANRARLEAGLARCEAERADREAGLARREAERADHETERANREAERAEKLAEKLRALGIDPEA